MFEGEGENVSYASRLGIFDTILLNFVKNFCCPATYAPLRVAMKLLHIGNRDMTRTDDENWSICHNFSSFFMTQKTQILNVSITHIISTVRHPNNTPDHYYTGSPLNSFHPVTSAEVPHLINKSSSKSSPLDFIPTSLIKSCSSVDNIYHLIDTGSSTVLIFLDLSPAFDTIDHSILLYRLQTSFDITGSALAWFRSYRCERSQFVRIDDSKSPVTSSFTGVPQWSILGPLLLYFTSHQSDT